MSELPDDRSVQESLGRLEERISRIEAYLGLSSESGPMEDERARLIEQREALEQQIGQQLFAKLGIVALVLGFGFLLTLPYGGLSPWVPGMLGCLIAGSMVVLARHYRAALGHIAPSLAGGGIVLLFFAALRLHFFTTGAPIPDRGVESVVLAAAAFAGLLLASFWRSSSLILLSLSLVDAAALVSGEPLVVFGGAALTVGAAWGLAARAGHRDGLLTGGIVLAFVAHLLWFLNVPMPGRAVVSAGTLAWSAGAVLLYMALGSAGSLSRPGREGERRAPAVSLLVNGVGGYLLFVFVSLTKFGTGFVAQHLAAFVLLAAVAVLISRRQPRGVAASLYAVTGFIALSAAIIAAAPPPACFHWLSLQSVLVIATALWWKSRLLVAANFLIFLALAAAAALLAGAVSPVMASVGAAALISARALTVYGGRTGSGGALMRGGYLAAALIAVPAALASWMPSGFVSQSWLLLALSYYLAARLLHAAAYRWMALLTLCLTAGYVLLVDLARIEPVYRVISCIILGTVLLAVSLAYARRRGRGRPPRPDLPVPGTGTAFTSKGGLT